MKASQKTLASIGLGVVLSAGALVAWLTFQSLVIESIMQGFNSDTTERLIATSKGQVLIKSSSKRQVGYQYRTLDGIQFDDTNNLREVYGSAILFPRPSPTTGRWPGRILNSFTNQPSLVNWFATFTERPAFVFEGYDQRSNRRIGYIGRNGFSINRPPLDQAFVSERVDDWPMVTQWENNSPTGVLFAANNQLLLADFDQQKVREIHIAGTVVSLRDWMRLGVKDIGESMSGLLVRSNDRVYFLGKDDAVQESIPIPEELREDSFTLYLPEQTARYILVQSDLVTGRQSIFWIDAKGTVTDRKEVVLNPPTLEGRRKTARWMAINVPIPMLAGFIDLFSWPASEVTTGTLPDLSTAQQVWWSATWPSLLTLLIISAILAVWTYRRQLRYEPSMAFAWGAFVFLLGPPGLVGYLVHRRWPIRQKCPSCQAVVPVDRITCLACGNEFPLPATNGTEIMVPA